MFSKLPTTAMKTLLLIPVALIGVAFLLSLIINSLVPADISNIVAHVSAPLIGFLPSMAFFTLGWLLKRSGANLLATVLAALTLLFVHQVMLGFIDFLVFGKTSLSPEVTASIDPFQWLLSAFWYSVPSAVLLSVVGFVLYSRCCLIAESKQG